MHKCIIVNNFNIDNLIPSCCGTNDSKHSTKTDLLPTMEVLHVFHAERMHPSHCLLLDLIWALLRIAEHLFCRLDILEVDFAGVFSEPEVDRGKSFCVWCHSMQRQIFNESLTCILPMSSDVCMVIKLWCFMPLLCTLFRLNWAKQTPGIMRQN